MDSHLQPRLISEAVSAREQAYAPYSGFRVGAAVLTAEGQVFVGANIENASYGLTLCAERSAVAAAVTAGARQLEAVALASTGAASPCGACRQFLAEFGGDMEVLLVDPEKTGEVRRVSLAELLPDQFEMGEK